MGPADGGALAYDRVRDDAIRVTDVLGERTYLFSGEFDGKLTELDAPDFPFATDSGFEVTAGSVEIAAATGVVIRAENGDHVTSVVEGSKTFGDGRWLIESDLPGKLYLRVPAAFTVTKTEASDAGITIRLDAPTQVQFGFRSIHLRPNGVITTPPNVPDILTAISHLSSSLKEFSCERSWPSMRGHPPAIELGDDLVIPDHLSRPDSGITIEIPPTFEAAYTVAPLAFYLGADIMSGDRPRITTRHGLDESLLVGGSLPRGVRELLARCVLFDSFVRTTGYVKYPSYEMQSGALDLPFELVDIYAMSPAKALAEYIAVPYEAVEPYMFDWPLEATIDATAESVELLPHLLADSALVRTLPSDTPGERGSGGVIGRTVNRVRSAFAGPDDTSRSAAPVDEGAYEVRHRTWGPSDTPYGYGQLVPEAFTNRLTRTPSEEFTIAVVCNDTSMLDEAAEVAASYERMTTGDVAATVHEYTDVTVSGLARVLRSNHQFLHYIGHANPDGLACADGRLDVGALDDLDVQAFLLNACQSQEQGVQLVRGGARGGLVTMAEIVTERAVATGALISKLLYLGYPLSAALEISVRSDPVFAGNYRVVGDGYVNFARGEAGDVAIGIDVESRGVDEHVCLFKSYPREQNGVGTIHHLFGEMTTDLMPLLPASVPQVFTMDEMLAYFEATSEPVFLTDGSFHWSEDITRADVLASLPSDLV